MSRASERMPLKKKWYAFLRDERKATVGTSCESDFFIEKKKRVQAVAGTSGSGIFVV